MSITKRCINQGYTVAQQALDTISTNINNASTPGYTRKILPQETQIINEPAVGVTSSTPTREVNATRLLTM